MTQAIKLLLAERNRLVTEKAAAIGRFDKEIESIDISIEQLSGTTVEQITNEAIYDDLNPGYVTASHEEQ